MTPRSTWLLLASFSWAACAPPSSTSKEADATEGSDTDDGTEEPIDGLTWYTDVKPLMETHCVSCHQEGAVGTFSLDSLEAVSLVSEQVADAVQNRRMPPWKAVEGCDDYRADISLSDDEINTIVDWVDGGKLEGDITAEVNGEVGDVDALERVDLTLELPVAYTPSATETDDYRCFPMQWPVEEDSFVTGFAVSPDQAALVHHVIAYIASASYGDALLEEEAADGLPGYPCYGGPGVIDQSEAAWLGAWAPGASQGNFPNGVGIQMDAGDWVILQMHYNNVAGITAEDRTSIDFQLESEVERFGWIQPFTNPTWVMGAGMEIPAGSSGVTHSFEFEMGMNLEAHTANVHMHELGTRGNMTLVKADGTEDCLIQIDDWDFDWQRSYAFQRKKLIEPGDVWQLGCEWDNPTDQDVAWGDGTGDEMCLGSMLLSLP